jgi:hypothetical protein
MYWGFQPHELGISFVGVGGARKYTPFLRLAIRFGIPWCTGALSSRQTLTADVYAAFGGKDTLLVSPVKDELLHAGKGSKPNAEPARALAGSTGKESIPIAVVFTKELKEQLTRRKGLEGIAPELDAATAVVTVSDGVELQLGVQCDSWTAWPTRGHRPGRAGRAYDAAGSALSRKARRPVRDLRGQRI